MTSDGRKIDDEAHQSHRLVDQFPSWIFLDELHRIVLQRLIGNLQCDEEKNIVITPQSARQCQASSVASTAIPIGAPGSCWASATPPSVALKSAPTSSRMR